MVKIIADIIAGFASGILGSMGFGGGGILILYLTLYRDLPQLNAQGINLIFFIPSAIIALIKHQKNNLIEWKISFNLVLCGMLGVIIGILILNHINESVLKNIFAALLIVIGVKDLLSKRKK